MNLLFVHITKTAGWSVISLLEALSNFYTTNHNPITWEPNYRDYVSFCIVRNPFERVFSQWEWYTKKRQQIAKCSFEDFVMNYEVYAQQPNMKNNLKPCFDYISVDGEVVVNEILRYETLQHDWQIFSGKYDLPNILPNEHINPHKTEYALDLYTSKMEAKVREIFTKDFDLYKIYKNK